MITKDDSKTTLKFPTPENAKGRLARRLYRFKRDESGSIMILAVYMLIMLFMVAGIGIDLMRFERDRSALQYTLDRAVLAAADLEQTLDPTAVVEDYFAKEKI